MKNASVLSSYASTDENTLIQWALAGRQEPFAEIVRRYRSALLAGARSRVGDFDLAEEVVQETFLCVWKFLASYNSRYSFRTWLWTILLNQCRRQMQRRRKHADKETSAETAAPFWDQFPDLLPSPSAQVLEQERAARVRAALRELPEVQADALRLRFFGGLKFQEIAETMQCSLSTAKNRVRWGLEKMAEGIRETAADLIEEV